MLENRLLEIIIIALVVLVLFGAKRLPDTARSLGKSLRILKAESRAGREEAAQKAQDGETDQPPVLIKGTTVPTYGTHTGNAGAPEREHATARD
ncbi:Sec-independent protein translocase subunit TatA [Streptomyces sp. S.PB5]|uniref:Sec-independent protein translocase subunit TatA n=1 Tax=Streptomyces sp. S.PB5 TaxID=3020844 RepID=UPI0025B228A3|nr:Sec-independent protein translocase subunit TatA [Streptomyces sp. S.PB5]MDN3022767.1 Sec-independent protein translocase subunit TatA [Streptomyces sp. S.PB5]